MEMVSRGELQDSNLNMAIMSLGHRRSTRSVELILKILAENVERNQDPMTFWAGVVALGEIGDSRAIEPLRQYLAESQNGGRYSYHLNSVRGQIEVSISQILSPNKAL